MSEIKRIKIGIKKNNNYWLVFQLFDDGFLGWDTCLSYSDARELKKDLAAKEAVREYNYLKGNPSLYLTDKSVKSYILYTLQTLIPEQMAKYNAKAGS